MRHYYYKLFKLGFLFLTLFLLVIVKNVHSQSWIWGRSMLGTEEDFTESLTTDVFGNVYVLGTFTSPTITVGTIVLTNNSTAYLGHNIFLVKYDPTGNVLWAKSMGGNETEYPRKIATDKLGNLYITGSFGSASITFGAYTLNRTGNWGTFFLVKFDTSGNVQWAKGADGPSGGGEAMTCDDNGNIYISGSFGDALQSSVTFDTHTITNPNPGGGTFLTKYDPSGNILWINQPTNWAAHSIHLDNSGNIVVVGHSVLNGSLTDIFLAELNPLNGNIIWSKSGGGPETAITSVAFDNLGNIYVCGMTTSLNISFDAISITYSGQAYSEGFLVKYDQNGNALWAKGTQTPSLSNTQCMSVAVDHTSSNFYLLLGTWYGITSFTFGANTIMEPNNAQSPSYILKCDPNGDVLCSSALIYGGNGWSHLATSLQGDVYLSAMFGVYGQMALGPDTLICGGLPGSYNVFVAKYVCCSTPDVQIIAPTTSVCQGDSIVLIASGATTYSWTPTGSGLTCSSCFSPTATPTGVTTYTLVGTECSLNDTTTITLTTIPVPNAIINGDTIICSGQFTNLVASGGASYIWNNGQATSSIVVSPTNSTNYAVVVSNGNCSSTDSIWLTVNPTPMANISSENTIIYEGGSTTLIVSGGSNYLWNNGNTNSEITISPQQDTTYCVAVSNTNNCTDTVCILVTVEPNPDSTYMTFYIPNAFTPNDDNIDDTFTGKGIFFEKFEMMIFDRWGNLIYETDAIDKPWNGKANSGKEMAQADVYAYVIKVNDLKSKKYIYKGRVTLLR